MNKFNMEDGMDKTKQTSRPASAVRDLPEEVEEALRRVVDYLWEDEQADYWATPPRDGRERHIFVALRRISGWLARRA